MEEVQRVGGYPGAFFVGNVGLVVFRALVVVSRGLAFVCGGLISEGGSHESLQELVGGLGLAAGCTSANRAATTRQLRRDMIRQILR